MTSFHLQYGENAAIWILDKDIKKHMNKFKCIHDQMDFQTYVHFPKFIAFSVSLPLQFK